MIPDGSKLIRNYLQARAAIVALGTRIVGKTPDEGERATSWVRVTQLDAPLRGTRHNYEFYFQFDCYAGATGGQPEATTLARTVHDALAALDEANYQASGAVVSGCNPNMGLWSLDTEFKPARERYISTAKVWMHAL